MTSGTLWTPERRERQAALIRAVRPWERATGPRTPEGKSASSKNAQRSGSRREIARVRAALRRQMAVLIDLQRRLK